MSPAKRRPSLRRRGRSPAPPRGVTRPLSRGAARTRIAGDGGGRLRVDGARYVMIRPETMAALQRAVEAALGDRAAQCFVAAGRAGGRRAVTGLPGDGEARVRRLIETGARLGWGTFVLERLTADALVVTVRHSPFAEAYGPARGPVCHLIRGVLESLVATVLSRPLAVVETRCAAAGAPGCRFETAR